MRGARIEQIETLIVDLPTIRPHHLSMAVMRQQTMVLVRLFCSDGIEGIGEATTIGGLSYGDEFPEGMKFTIDTYIAPLLVGKAATSINAVMAELEHQVQGNNFAKSAIETALLDAQGKHLGVPVAELLGGAVTHTLPVLWTLASGDTAKDVEEAQELLANGRHNTFKLKIGRNDWKVDVRHVAAIKEAVGPDVKVTVDVNQAWTESIAKQGIAQLQDAGIDLIEQPIVKTNFEGLARLTQYFRVPIMADEAVATVSDAFKLARIGGGSVFALKISKAGGLSNIKKQAAIAQGAGISLYGGTMLEGTVGTVASAHVFSTLPNLDWGTELFGPLLLTDDIVKTRISYGNGKLEIPQGPGLGIELDMNQVEKYKRR
ncbi:muconate/chloromuconate family cycloisomerase [Pontibacter flavimaris]|uniref:Muconate cycloisomerase n=1 Tax=Pontibacter flavimaris TaxID=1797110 RepID=A0A1Q5P8G4_9BACT|nr:muconate/chloromuconate family cycloisomerase [Pontibacter flavimaris]OKL38550.1 muconate cycloisomerase [Pontibacter flavimaris]